MIDFDCFRGRMEHEFVNSPLSLISYGYKLDGTNGIKLACLMNAYKSLDYLYESNLQGQLIEFSDLFRQHKKIKEKIKSLKDSNLSRVLIKEYVKDAHAEIPKELTTKLKDTIAIINKMTDYVTDIPEWVSDTSNSEFLVIYMDFDQEFIRLLDRFRGNPPTKP